MIIKSDIPLSFPPSPLLPATTIITIELCTMPCSNYPDFIPTHYIPSITTAMLTTSISSPSSMTNTLPIIKPSIQPVSPMHPASPLIEQETLPPVFIATTQSDDFPHSPISIHSVDIPIYIHCLVNNFLDEQTNTYLSSQLLNSCLTTTLDGHMDMGLPLYALYKASLQCHCFTTLVSTNTANTHHVLCKQILHSIHEELEEDLFLAMYQLGMPAFADNVEQYCRDLSNASTTHTSDTPTTSSSPLSDKELQAVERSGAHWTGNFRCTPLSPDHPHYDKACFHCHHLEHIRINCQFYTCPMCLHNAPDHVQN